MWGSPLPLRSVGNEGLGHNPYLLNKITARRLGRPPVIAYFVRQAGVGFQPLDLGQHVDAEVIARSVRVCYQDRAICLGD